MFKKNIRQAKGKIEDSIKKLTEILRSGELNISDTIAIAGSPRSGTTWLMELLGNLPGHFTLCEPLHPKWFSGAARGNWFKPRPYIPLEDEPSELQAYLHSVFTGRVKSREPRFKLKYKNIIRRITGDRLVVKFVRANRILPWISKNVKIRNIILIIRHPCATISSQLRTNIDGYYPTLSHWKTKANLIKVIKTLDFLEKSVVKRVERINSKTEILAAIWALDQIIPIVKGTARDFITINYERLLIKSRREVNKLISGLGYKKQGTRLLKYLEKSSITAYGRERIHDFNYQISKWEKKLRSDQISQIRKVLDWFDITFDENSFNISDKLKISW